jgi:chromodomain-helicase-DNA-binding protein 4
MFLPLICNRLLKEVYLEDQRKPEWFEVDRAITCRRKSGSDSTCDILTAIQDNEGLQEYEFLVKWKGLDYCEATWESCCTEGVQDAISKLVEKHQSALKRLDCVSPTCLEGVITEDVHNGALYSYQHQGLQWIFDNYKARRNVILAGMFMTSKAVMHVIFHMFVFSIFLLTIILYGLCRSVWHASDLFL